MSHKSDGACVSTCSVRGVSQTRPQGRVRLKELLGAVGGVLKMGILTKWCSTVYWRSCLLPGAWWVSLKGKYQLTCLDELLDAWLLHDPAQKTRAVFYLRYSCTCPQEPGSGYLVKFSFKLILFADRVMVIHHSFFPLLFQTKSCVTSLELGSGSLIPCYSYLRVIAQL